MRYELRWVSGIGQDYDPVPSKLTYNEDLGGFQIDITKEQLEAAPRYGQDDDFEYYEDNNRRICDYYGTQPYW